MSPFGKKASPKKEAGPVDLWGSHRALQRRSAIRKISRTRTRDFMQITKKGAPRNDKEISEWEKKLFTPRINDIMRRHRDPSALERALRNETIKRGTVEEQRRFDLLKRVIGLKN